ncbi:hypothetical protein [Aerolutibacter ruishenii]|uniref:Nickel/cobalt transporter regulator n=1 Tax=Aerolutibacter ruishenii TaxID=686800 RepID=A0A562LVB7_9GAMM|nr:hypothetical protein [Lysobacter ruishenii]TWI11599.1 hypothetical protein IP93_01500 [Lysobacter ruishenii]
MKTRILAASLLTLLGLAGAAVAQDTAVIDASGQASTVTTGDTLLIERVQDENKAAMPARGMTMAQVEARYGAPGEKLEPRGGQKRQWPTINRWTYPDFVVYFEKSKVIDAVAVKADATEVGPKPPIR